MSIEEPIKKRFTCPSCGNNVTAPPEDVVEPVECPHCGQTGQFIPAKPKPESADEDSAPSGETPPERDERDAAADALAASEFSDEPVPEPEPSPGHERKAPPRRKKTITPPRRGDARDGGSSAGRRRPGYRRHAAQPAPVTREGVSLMTVFLIIVAVVLSVIIAMVMIPKNLDFIKGYPAKSPGGGAKPRNLLAEVQQILGPQDRALSFTEAEVNAFLNHRVQGKQRGFTSGLVKFKGAYADFENGRVEFYIERTVIGIPFTMSLKVTQTRFKHKTRWEAGGGSIGKFGLSSRQFKPIVDAFARLGAACEEEVDAIDRMMEVKFEKDKVTLIPALAGSGKTPAPPPDDPAGKSAPDSSTATTAAPGETPAAAEPGESPPAMESGNPAMTPGDGENMEGMAPDSNSNSDPSPDTGANESGDSA